MRILLRKRGLCCRPVSVRLSFRPSRWCIVSRRLKLSSNFFLCPVATWFQFIWPRPPILNSKGNPFSGGAKYTWVGNFFATVCYWKRFFDRTCDSCNSRPTTAFTTHHQQPPASYRSHVYCLVTRTHENNNLSSVENDAAGHASPASRSPRYATADIQWLSIINQSFICIRPMVHIKKYRDNKKKK